MGGSGDSAVQTDKTDGLDATWQAHTFGDLGDRPDLGVRPVVPWHEQHAALVGHIGGDRDVHVRKDDDVVKWDKQQRGQPSSPFCRGYTFHSSFRQ
jgi:hypothetical protein